MAYFPIDTLEAETILLHFGSLSYEVTRPPGARYMSLPHVNKDGIPVITWTGDNHEAMVTVALEKSEK